MEGNQAEATVQVVVPRYSTEDDLCDLCHLWEEGGEGEERERGREREREREREGGGSEREV